MATALAGTALIAAPAIATKVGGGPAPQRDSGTSYASITHTRHGLEYAAGNNYDKVLGEGAITYQLKLIPNSNGTIHVKVPKVVLFTTTGSLTGTASATVTINGSNEQITNGKLDLKKGNGTLKGKQFSGTFTGTGDLAKNLITFNYKGLIITA
jgi:hypothetical protein